MSARTALLPLFGLLGLLLAVPSSVLSAQEDWYPPPRAHVGINFVVGEPIGEFADFVGVGAGADLFGRLPMDPDGVLSFRGDLGFLIYGHESKRVCFEGVGCRVQGRLQTDNSIFYGGIGPELAIPMRNLRPYVHPFVGFAYFSTTSSLEDDWGEDNLFETENFGDGGFLWGIGGGLEWSLSQGPTRIDLNLGARYHHHGVMEYLTKGDIVDNSDGSITMYPVVSEANLMSYHLGVTIGFPRWGGDH